jgi:outer membrane beta-barrel protein
METRARLLLLSLAASLLLGGCASMRAGKADAATTAADAAAEEPSTRPPRVVEPEVERRKIKVARIDADNVEIGGSYGSLSIEDFGTNATWGVSAAYHVTEDFFFQGNFGRSKAGKTSYETLGGNVQLLTPAERQFTYYSLSLGYNLFPGEVYIGRSLAMNSGLYVMGGIGSTKFAGDQQFTVNFGAGYRLLPTDWLAIHIDVQDHVFRSDLLGTEKLVNNLGAGIGLTVFF